MSPRHDHALTEIIRNTSWLMEVLEAVRVAGPPGAYVAAGAVRDTVWGALTGRPLTAPPGDVDVVYWDDSEAQGAAHSHQARLRAALPRVDWEVTNQALVHEWHWQAHGLRVAPLGTLTEGLETWPETATAVGVRLTAAGALDVLAPLGLEDLFALRVRYHPQQASAEVFWLRVAAKRWLQRWPELQLLGPDGHTAPPGAQGAHSGGTRAR
jgi:uncharacterized protein